MEKFSFAQIHMNLVSLSKVVADKDLPNTPESRFAYKGADEDFVVGRTRLKDLERQGIFPLLRKGFPTFGIIQAMCRIGALWTSCSIV